MGKQIVYRAVWVPSLIAIIAMVVIFARAPLAIPAPAEMVTYSTDDKTIVFKHPANWKPHSMSMHAVQTEAWIEPARNVNFHINSDLQGSIMADFARAGNNMASNFGSITGTGGSESSAEEKRKSPLEQLHDMKGEKMSKNFPDYQEGITTKLTIGGLEAIETDFTYTRSTMFGKREMSGARFTALHSDRGIGLVYNFPKELQGQVEPVFKRIVKSLEFHQEGQ